MDGLIGLMEESDRVIEGKSDRVVVVVVGSNTMVITTLVLQLQHYCTGIAYCITFTLTSY